MKKEIGLPSWTIKMDQSVDEGMVLMFLDGQSKRGLIAVQQFDIIIIKLVTPIFIKYHHMCERKIWKVEEDQILKQLYEKRGIKKWSEISKIMEQEYQIEGRNGKQCRERYHNHLKGGINKEKWSREQEQRLVQLHVIHGNRWALISKLIPGRTENCVKNMLYSKMRKSIRQLNRFSYQHYRKQLKEIKISFIYRLIEFTEQTYLKGEDNRTEQENAAIKIKNQILRMSFKEDDQLLSDGKESVKNLIQEIHIFKRVNQRFRGNSTKNYRSRAIKKEKESTQGLSGMQDEQSSRQQKELKISEALVLKTKDEGHYVTQSSYPTEVEVIIQNANKISKSHNRVLRNDSLDSNRSAFLVDYILEKPIQMELPFINLTPTPQHQDNQRYEDWNNSINWHSFFTCE